VRADAAAGTAARNLSTDSVAVGNKRELAREMNDDILELGPREVLLPKVKPRREALTSHRGVFMRCNLPRVEFKAVCNALPLADGIGEAHRAHRYTTATADSSDRAEYDAT
jgi:hypothetical protein